MDQIEDYGLGDDGFNDEGGDAEENLDGADVENEAAEEETMYADDLFDEELDNDIEVDAGDDENYEPDVGENVFAEEEVFDETGDIVEETPVKKFSRKKKTLSWESRKKAKESKENED